MFFTIPEEAIALYDEGFNTNKQGVSKQDILQRAQLGKSLSRFLERVEDPVVVAVDGGWGTGKTYFLQKWVGAHGIENYGKAITVYFDAFAHDYLDDPLIAIMGAVNDRISKLIGKNVLKSNATWQKAKRVAVKASIGLAKGVLSAATGGLGDVAIDAVNGAIDGASNETNNILDEYWKNSQGKMHAMGEFRKVLKEFVTGFSQAEKPANEPTDKDHNTLIIVIDELDRCRPDYALSVLEIIKHFFNVRGVQFVLGVNLKSLQHSVKARYGTDIDAEAYLRRFINIPFTLPQYIGDDEQGANSVLIQFINATAKKIKLSPTLSNIICNEIIALNYHNVSIRDVKTILSYISVVGIDEKYAQNIHYKKLCIIVSSIVMSVVNPDLFNKIMRLKFEQADLLNHYGLSQKNFDENDSGNPKPPDAHIIYDWEYFRTNGVVNNIINKDLCDAIKKSFDDHFNVFDTPEVILKKILKEYVDIISIIK